MAIREQHADTARRAGRTRRLREGLATGWTLPRLGRVGLAATALITLGSFGAGALPANDPTRHIPVIGLLRHGEAGLRTALAFYYLGLALLIIVWLLLGRLLLTGSAGGEAEAGREVVDPGVLRRWLIRWMLPLLVGMPLASMDLYSYAAQAQLAKHGFNPYVATPADLPGKFLDNVAWKWVDTPSPYGPLWVSVSRWVAAITGNHALISVLLLRLLPFAGIVVIAFLLPGIAGLFGRRADLALWLAVANPLVLVHGVGGGHNDAVMVAFIVAGLAVVLRPNATLRHLAGAAALMTLAAAIKAPGAIALGFVVPIYLARTCSARPRDWLRCCGLVLAVCVPVFAAVSLIAGVGLGWAKQVSPAVPVINFMSIPTVLAVGYRAAIGAAHPGTYVDATVRAFRRVGTVVSGIVVVGLWWRALREQAMQLLALALVVIVVLGPAVQPWYFTWALTIAAVFVVAPRQVSWIAMVSIALTLLVRPMGSGLELAPYVPAVLAAGLASRALLGPVAARAGRHDTS